MKATTRTVLIWAYSVLGGCAFALAVLMVWGALAYLAPWVAVVSAVLGIAGAVCMTAAAGLERTR